MPVNFPGSNDNFTEPSTPASTVLNSAGDSTRNHTLNHQDLGDAIEALQAEATFLAHTHDGTTRNGSKLSQVNTHQTPDTDSSTTALHHTIGTGANQGAAGNHTHGAPNVWPVGSIFITELSGDPAAVHGLPGTWTAVTGRFIVAAGGSFTNGSTGGSSTHNHAASYVSNGDHSHSSASTSTDGSHAHAGANSNDGSFYHDHGSSTSDYSYTNTYRAGGGSAAETDYYHSHSSGGSSQSTHNHANVDTTAGVGGHSHTVPGMDTQGGHSHTAAISTVSHIPPYLAVYVWERTA